MSSGKRSGAVFAGLPSDAAGEEISLRAEHPLPAARVAAPAQGLGSESCPEQSVSSAVGGEEACQAVARAPLPLEARVPVQPRTDEEVDDGAPRALAVQAALQAATGPPPLSQPPLPTTASQAAPTTAAPPAQPLAPLQQESSRQVSE